MVASKHIPHAVNQELCDKVRELAHALDICVDFKVVKTSVSQKLEQMNLGNDLFVDGLEGELDVLPADFRGQPNRGCCSAN